MNYSKHYKKLIDRSPKLSWDGVHIKAKPWCNRDGTYREGHRIVPGCMGGKYTCDNVTYLTPEEHYVAHQLLVKIYPGTNKLVLAVAIMSKVGKGHRLYGWLKRLCKIPGRPKGVKETKPRKKKPTASYRNARKASSIMARQFIWITNGEDSIRTRVHTIPIGWRKGRTFKTNPNPFVR